MDIRGFPKKDHSGSAAIIVFEQSKFSKKLPLTEIEPRTLGIGNSSVSLIPCQLC